MFVYRHILYCTDFSDYAAAAFPVALDLAQKYGAALHILHVYQEPGDVAEFEVSSNIHMDWIRVAHFVGTEREKKLQTLREEALKSVKDVSFRMLRGKPQIEIARYAREVGADLAVISSHGLSGIEHAIFGGTAEKIMRETPCAVLVVKKPRPNK
jgi:nucleotide-binding universal stress UspA family protein